MIRTFAIALFVLPKLVIWPLVWLFRCHLKKKCAKVEEDAYIEVEEKISTVKGEEQY
jgi:hypothetical protein